MRTQTALRATFSCSAACWERLFTSEGRQRGANIKMMEHFEGRVGDALAITLSGEIQAISFTCSVPFEFRLVRNHEPRPASTDPSETGRVATLRPAEC